MRPLNDIFRPRDNPDLLVGLAPADDAAVYRISDDVAIIQTVDFFTPIVDDPYQYGAIAAANAMSDVYAMGGEVVLALNVVALPADLPPEIGQEIMRGGGEKVREAGGIIAGGHTITDKEPKYGLAVMGKVHPARVVTKAGAQPGDALVLTKPLGVGAITTALKQSVADPQQVEGAVAVMMTLNRLAARIMQEVGVHAATDITGFSLLGHSLEMAQASGVRLCLHLSQLPFLDGARQYAELGCFPGGSHRNKTYYSKSIAFEKIVPSDLELLLYTPETSGGLLIAVPQVRLERLTSRFRAEGQPYWAIGEVERGEGIVVTE